MASHPERIGKYNVEGVLGRGGMGVVYKAVDSQIGRYVAIKMINAGGDASLLERFRSEARSTGQLQSCPNIVTVFDFGEQDGNPYLVMQYLEGSSLESLFQKGVSLTLSERLGIVIDVCNGLAFAHQRGVIHRDIKPGNIMVLQDGINDGMAVIVDFGIARIGGDTRLTRTDQIIGSFHYMAAEQFRQEELDNRTDIYAIGVVLFQLLTGALPFDAPDTAAIMYQIVHEAPPPLSKYIKEYPVELEAIIARALANKREERYANAKDFAFDLLQVQEHLKSETVAQLFQRAEVSLRREEWTRAREHLLQVLRLDRQNTQAQKLMNSVQERLRQLQQVEQARSLRSQADEAYLDQRYDDALRLLDQAVGLDASNSDLQAFRDSVRAAKERATSLRRALRRAEAALQDGDLDEAQSAVGEAFKIDPEDTQAKALKTVIAQQAEEKVRHEHLRKLLDEARKQIEARNLTAAFNLLKTAETLDPTSNELQTVTKLAMATREQEKRRVETEALRKKIETLLREEDYAAAVASADEGLRKFPQDQSLLKLKTLAEAQRVRVELKKFVREQFSAANSLADAGQVRQGVTLLERALQRAPGNGELESLRASLLDRLATEEAGQRRVQAVESTLAEGERILQERGARDATEFLASRSDEYADSQSFRELYDSVRERGTMDALESRLASEQNPARQIQLAEEALRQNPNNRWIQERVAGLHRLRDQINAVIGRAEVLEASDHLPEARNEWQQLSNSYPQVPEFEAQVRRISDLLESRKTTARAAVEPRKPEELADPLSATRVLNSGVLPRKEATKAEVPAESARPPAVPPRTKIEMPRGRSAPPMKPIQPEPDGGGLLAGPRKYILVASAVIVLIVVGYLMIGGAKKVSVSIDTNPSGAVVTVDAKKCIAKCNVELMPGTYELRVEKDGYVGVARNVSITADTKALPVIELVPVAPPKPDQGILVVQSNVDKAEVWMDGTFKGLTDDQKKYANQNVLVGDHKIEVKKSGYGDASQSVTIAKNQTSDVALTLKVTEGPKPPEPAYLMMQTQPGASVFIDRQYRGTAPADGNLPAKVEPGRHNIEAKLEGFTSWSGSATAASGKQLSVVAHLEAVAKPKPKIDSFTAHPTSIQPGETVQLSWKAENAVELSINSIGTVRGTSTEVKPTQTTTYVLTARGPDGTTISSDSVPITVVAVPPPPPPPVALKPATIEDFEASPTEVRTGGSTLLIWETQNAMEVSIDGKAVEPRGHLSVKPPQTHQYVLLAKGKVGEPVQKPVTVTVEPEPPPTPSKDNDTKCVARFKDAYESLVIDEVQKVWPSLDSKRRSLIKDSFKGAQAIKIEENQCIETPSASSDKVQYNCSETMTYTISGKRQKPQTSPVEFVCHKTAAGWVVDSHTVK